MQIDEKELNRLFWIIVLVIFAGVVVATGFYLFFLTILQGPSKVFNFVLYVLGEIPVIYVLIVLVGLIWLIGMILSKLKT